MTSADIVCEETIVSVFLFSLITHLGTSTDMVVMQVGLPTGFVADQNSLALLIGTTSIKRTELSADGSSVAIYFDDAVIGQKKCVSFLATDTLGVKGLQPAGKKKTDKRAKGQRD